MGLGMQIDYLGFGGSPAIEAEAGVQLLRLGRFNAVLSECHLAVELLRLHGRPPTYEVQLDLFSPLHERYPGGHGESEDPEAAVRAAFDAAERILRAGGVPGDGAHGRDH